MATTRKAFLAPMFALLAFFALSSAIAEAEKTENKNFDVSGFTRVSLRGSSHVEVIQGDHFAVHATGPTDVMPHAKAEVRGSTLELSVDDNTQNWFGVITITRDLDQKVQFTVTMPKVEGIEVTGSGQAVAETLESETLDLKVTGSGTVRVAKAAAENLSAYVTGSGDLILDKALSVSSEIGISGSGDIFLGGITGEKLTAEIKGSGDMRVGGRVADVNIRIMGSGDFVGRSLRADNASGSVMGSGDIVLKRPQKDSFSVMGSGDVALVD
ncbi:GIN domain-containing protein [Microbulbifer sp. CnH-101-G]|uniref:GIN domain-containing protein n=1 Tax=Microbulbifer sp. CnH-101-G TaxID=3243393 RepID=UPI00403A449B